MCVLSFLQCQPAVDRPWKGSSPWQRGGGQRAAEPPAPSYVVMAECGPGQARPPGDAHGCRNRSSLQQSETGLAQQCTDRRTEWKMKG